MNSTNDTELNFIDDRYDGPDVGELYDIELEYNEEMPMRAYEENVGIELYDDEVLNMISEPEYLGDR
ncbi:hypothetical protein HOE22_02385 [Candidatus Woesearchaeota archaeon]|nr:hypothetical protein [Candidatus Woesearchaeota archaeon]MBT4731953.1 hypothetical protein [Candidatus Woesearchaeota archaeon]MBT7556457.1 hypothetical protein [Candidatus Woesearchaeota archaeon]